jgi:hypothetical protein
MTRLPDPRLMRPRSAIHRRTDPGEPAGLARAPLREAVHGLVTLLPSYPAPPRKTLITALIAASMDPAGAWIWRALGPRGAESAMAPCCRDHLMTGEVAPCNSSRRCLPMRNSLHSLDTASDQRDRHATRKWLLPTPSPSLNRRRIGGGVGSGHEMTPRCSRTDHWRVPRSARTGGPRP